MKKVKEEILKQLEHLKHLKVVEKKEVLFLIQLDKNFAHNWPEERIKAEQKKRGGYCEPWKLKNSKELEKLWKEIEPFLKKNKIPYLTIPQWTIDKWLGMNKQKYMEERLPQLRRELWEKVLGSKILDNNCAFLNFLKDSEDKNTLDCFNMLLIAIDYFWGDKLKELSKLIYHEPKREETFFHRS